MREKIFDKKIEIRERNILGKGKKMVFRQLLFVYTHGSDRTGLIANRDAGREESLRAGECVVEKLKTILIGH